MYNDEPPNAPVSFIKGHTKGVVLGNKTSGLWLVHSVPKFPNTQTGSYYYPHNGQEYGQSFLCISFDLNNLNRIGNKIFQLSEHIDRQVTQDVTRTHTLTPKELIKKTSQKKNLGCENGSMIST